MESVTVPAEGGEEIERACGSLELRCREDRYHSTLIEPGRHGSLNIACSANRNEPQWCSEFSVMKSGVANLETIRFDQEVIRRALSTIRHH
jgi:hypothetical protein